MPSPTNGRTPGWRRYRHKKRMTSAIVACRGSTWMDAAHHRLVGRKIGERATNARASRAREVSPNTSARAAAQARIDNALNPTVTTMATV